MSKLNAGKRGDGHWGLPVHQGGGDVSASGMFSPKVVKAVARCAYEPVSIPYALLTQSITVSKKKLKGTSVDPLEEREKY
jgi:hypothetical protein